MSIFNDTDSLLRLADLLNPQSKIDDSESEDDENPNLINKLNPGSFGATQQEFEAKPVKTQNEPPVEKMPKSFEEWEEMQANETAEILETRKCPEYKMTYRQAVGTEDVFLQMGNRSASSASCEDLLLEIMLPGETMPAEKMTLSIKEQEIDLGTNMYRLKLPLVHKVDVDRCKAQYDVDLQKMCLALRLKREFDYVNF
ncbi:dynein assembly factor 6, axonemal [Teleopsis dalmanni]|uniref:dynein assembly factor 6, axonemal n=1 Tax=Teleopsis dalmanni TaxID=139649 RepID=UPI0018CCBC08|nr:dynein assembly factor 6, axonemal [Teleopsis dalmanni]